MRQHQFAIGESIKFKFHLRTRSAAPGQYRIVGYQPSEAGEPRYRIKSELEQYERIAREDELNRIS